MTDAPAPFVREYAVRWSDLDPIGHMRHTAYADYAADVRMRFLDAHGFSVSALHARQLGPVLLAEHLHYLREVHAGEAITVDLEIASLSADGSHWEMHHTITKANGKAAATVRVDGAWLDLAARRLTLPPADLLALVERLPHTRDFKIIPAIPRLKP